MRQVSNKPIRKIKAVWVSSGVSAVTIAVLIKWLWPLLFPMLPIDNAEAAAIAAVVVALVSGAFGYYTPPSPLDVPVSKAQQDEG